MRGLSFELDSIHVLIRHIEYSFHVHAFAIRSRATTERELVFRMPSLIPPSGLPGETLDRTDRLFVRGLGKNDQEFVST